ncbi:MAG: site-specific DNA-methyltransferase [Lachnospiraceae bacterium]|nr:site-specific DNA-methyltransferase [Lachnospiraceae bacterium]
MRKGNAKKAEVNGINVHKEEKDRSPRNKTLYLTDDKLALYSGRCIAEKDLESGKDIELSKIIDRTVLGDSISVMSHLPKGFADLVIVDPPYNLNKDFGGNRFKKTGSEEYRDYTANWIERIVPLLSDRGSLYVCCDWLTSTTIYDVLKDHLIIRNRITWQREKGRGAKSNWKNGMEDIWFATKSNSYTFNLEAVKQRRRVIAPYKEDGEPKDWEDTADGRFRDTHPSNFWDDISVPFWSMSENTEHPTQKPEKLIAKLILASSNEGDIVFDPFLGSGTTSVTAKKLGRHYLGIEQNEKYCAWTEKRLEEADRDKSIQGYEDGVFWERNTYKRSDR